MDSQGRSPSSRSWSVSGLCPAPPQAAGPRPLLCPAGVRVGSSRHNLLAVPDKDTDRAHKEKELSCKLLVVTLYPFNLLFSLSHTYAMVVYSIKQQQQQMVQVTTLTKDHLCRLLSTIKLISSSLWKIDPHSIGMESLEASCKVHAIPNILNLSANQQTGNTQNYTPHSHYRDKLYKLPLLL